MTSRQRLLAALNGDIPDRLPATTHHVMPYFLENSMNNISDQEFLDHFKLDAVMWIQSTEPDPEKGEFVSYEHGGIRSISSQTWQVKIEDIPHPDYRILRFHIETPRKNLSMTIQSDEYTDWVLERLIKKKSDLQVFEEYAPQYKCDVKSVNRKTLDYGEKGIIRSTIPGFDIYGQPGCWQDAAVLFGIENLIMETFDDPSWVHSFLAVLESRKRSYLQTIKGAKFDLMELGGGDASSSVISPGIFEEFVAPYDSRLIEVIHALEQKVVYHTCGGMMPLLEIIAGMNPDAMETFTPSGMGGDVLLKEAKRRIGNQVCMIGGFDQYHYFKNCRPQETRNEVRRCFEEAGEGGGFILSPSDHFFEADIELIFAYADEAKKCIY
jgi:hypothetical protein